MKENEIGGFEENIQHKFKISSYLLRKKLQEIQ